MRFVPHLNVYVPDELEAKIKAEAKRAGLSISAFVVESLKDKLAPRNWSPEFVDLLRMKPSAPIPDEGPDPAPDDVPAFEIP